MIGTIIYYPTLPPPPGWLQCGGQAISRTKYIELFTLFGTTFGVGNGTTTFNLPDCRGRVLAGPNTMGGATQVRLGGSIAGSVSGATIGNTGGEEGHALTAVESPTAEDASFDQQLLDAPALTALNVGSVNAHNNVQPTIIIPVIIYSGVLDGDSIGT